MFDFSVADSLLYGKKIQGSQTIYAENFTAIMIQIELYYHQSIQIFWLVTKHMSKTMCYVYYCLDI
jgi:hypothetical protein